MSACSRSFEDHQPRIQKIPSPNYILSKYTLENQHILSCRDSVSEQLILKNLDPELTRHNRRSYYLFEMGLCHLVHGDTSQAKLYMYRAATYGDSYDLDISAKLLALHFMESDSESSPYDILWAAEILALLKSNGNADLIKFNEKYKTSMFQVSIEYAKEKLDKKSP